MSKESKKFDVVIGNPPYQGEAGFQLYPDFYTNSIDVANHVSMIFPVGWQEPKNNKNMGKMNNERVKRDEQIVTITNITGAFDNVAGAEFTNIILWKKDYDNGLEGNQLVIGKGGPKSVLLPINREDLPKPKEIELLYDNVKSLEGFKSMTDIVSPQRPYGLTSNRADTHEKYGLPPLGDELLHDTDIRIFTLSEFLYVPSDYPFPRLGVGFESYKVFVPKAWGNWSEQNGYGGAYANIYIGYPNDSSMQTYLECGSYETKEEAIKLAKYLMTSFARALMYLNKFSHNTSRGAYGAIPQQDFSEDWWNLTVAEIDDKLFEKYGVSDEIRDKVYENIQTRDESNIVDYGPKENNIKEMD